MVKKRLKIIWDDEAKHSLRSIYNYIKNRQSIEMAKKVRDEIASQAKMLNEFSEEDEETGWNSFKLRAFDPVIGRWMTIDPYGQYFSPYLGMGNNPINGVDPDGGRNEYQRQADGSSRLGGRNRVRNWRSASYIRITRGD